MGLHGFKFLPKAAGGVVHRADQVDRERSRLPSLLVLSVLETYTGNSGDAPGPQPSLESQANGTDTWPVVAPR